MIAKQTRNRDERRRGEVRGKCLDCGGDVRKLDDFMVRNEVWKESGMDGWDAGYLHLECLEKRLGSNIDFDSGLLVRYAWKPKGIVMQCHPEYLSSAEFREGSKESDDGG